MFKPIRNNRGQLAIFVALTFQVLFVFFAMVVNVGLLVHHKINLQNSVDIAAYYGAMKQAEMLGAIGHVNYQIRQSWKLLTWRTRVLGSMGYILQPGQTEFPHPVHGLQSDQDTEWAGSSLGSPICVAYRPLWHGQFSASGENLCRMALDRIEIPEIPVPQVIAGFASFNQTIRGFSQQMRQMAKNRCEIVGPINWWFSSGILAGYMQDVANRKKTLYALASALSNSTEDFPDVDGADVAAGAQKTFLKNLTRPNREAATSFRMFNSLAAGGCGGGDSNNPPGWLQDIQVQPTLSYVDYRCEGGARPNMKWVSQEPQYYNNEKQYIDPDGSLLASMQNYSDIPVEHPSVGVEKNPWCMAYVGVEATTRPQIPFSPLGQPIELKARAFAKPFGGRIGPWYESIWPSGSNRSSGGTKIDPLLPTRAGVGGEVPAEDDLSRVPNHSRYIGDTVGLKSGLSIYHQGRALYVARPLTTKRIHHSYYEQNLMLIDKGDNPAADILPWDIAEEGGDALFLRNLELASIAPDMFDVSYYSIDPDYYNNYYLRLKEGIERTSVGNFVFRPDLGARLGEALESFSIQNQISLVSSGAYYNAASRVLYQILIPDNLLTSWNGVSLTDYSFDTVQGANYFGVCHVNVTAEDAETSPQPGSCVAGGRTGYSVKLVSRDHLIQPNLSLGGVGTSGEILNPPPF